MRLLPIAALAALCVPSLAAHADTVYTYTGQDFNDVEPFYTSSDKITGELTFSSPLADNLGFQQAIPESYSFNDGLQTLTQANSTLTFAAASTDSSGSITGFRYFINSDSGSGFIRIDSMGADFAHFTAGVSLAYPGSFSGPLTSTSVTPEPSSIALLGTGVLGIVGVVRKRFA